MYDPNNIFAKIIKGEIPSEKIYEDDQILVINDINPAAEVHVLVLPKGEYIDFNDFISKASAEEIRNYCNKIIEIARQLGVNEYRLVTNIGEKAGQTIFHFHTHILAGKELKGLAG